MPTDRPAERGFEARLDALREEAGRTGVVTGTGMPIAGGPIPPAATAPVGYYGQPIVKPPVWTWQIGLYFFVGGTAGMSGVIALAGLLTGQPLTFVRAALALAFAGAVISPALLIADLGRPARFLNMLRVFKWRSAMSMGVWTLVAFGGLATAAPAADGMGPPAMAIPASATAPVRPASSRSAASRASKPRSIGRAVRM